ncbi:MAG: SDR family oxidoreductase [Gammaproteobacteria bacterium]|nr:SDR family oxidoreductase [Gammaproteobacteria bacterium]
MTSAVTDVLVIGCGDIGERVARRERSEGRSVAGVVRSEQSVRRLRAAGLRPIVADLDDPSSLKQISVKDSLVYYFAPPPANGVTDPRMEAFVTTMTAPNLPRRVVLISTTGVYGDCRGEWVTEDRPANPQVDRARRRLAAETALRRWSKASGVPIVILRVPGIYGPGYLPEERLRSGEPVLREEESPYSNRIHAADLAHVCFIAGHHDTPGALYNVSDGHPTTMTDFFHRVADLLGIPRPPAVTLEEARKRLGEGMLSYLAESRRIDNRRMREELGVELMYPDLASGLPSCFKRCG